MFNTVTFAHELLSVISILYHITIMQADVKLRDAVLIEPTVHFKPTGFHFLEDARDELFATIEALSHKAKLESLRFFDWFSAIAHMAGAVVVHSGSYRLEQQRKLQVLLAFNDESQSRRYTLNMPDTPSITDTRICPYVLDITARGPRTLHKPQPFFDAVVAGELFVLLDAESRFRKQLIGERRNMFSMDSERLLLEMLTHAVYYDLCTSVGLMDRKNPRNGVATRLLSQTAREKLEMLGTILKLPEYKEKIGEDDLFQITRKHLSFMRLDDDAGLRLSQRMAAGLQGMYQTPHPVKVQPIKRVKRTV